MTDKKIVQKKFEDLDILKGLLLEYPREYSEIIIEKMNSISKEISNYLNSNNRALPEFTLEQVAKFNGQNGMPAYIIISGTVYDTSDVDVWSGGSHFGVFAGNDLTEAFINCHLGKDEILQKLRPIGTLKE